MKQKTLQGLLQLLTKIPVIKSSRLVKTFISYLIRETDLLKSISMKQSFWVWLYRDAFIRHFNQYHQRRKDGGW